MARTAQTEKPYYVEIVEKPEEERVIFLIAGPTPPNGGLRRSLSAAEEEIAALTEKQIYEQASGRSLYQFHRDPMAGGLRPLKEPKGQQWRAAPEGVPVRKEKFVTDPSGNAISQGRIGDPIDDVQRRSNIERGTNVMIATAAWTAQWL